MLFLDFDRTLFDTERFLSYLAYTRPELAGILEMERSARNEIVGALAQAGKLSFAADELAQFVYPDALAFLRDTADLPKVLLTYGDEAVQRAKIGASGIEAFFQECLYTDTLKGEALPKGLVLDGEQHFFVDDEAKQLQSVRGHFPQIRLVQMNRYNALRYDELVPVISDMMQLLPLLTNTA